MNRSNYFAGVVAEMIGRSRELFNSEEGRFEAFCLLYQSLSFSIEQLEMIWSNEYTGLARGELDCSLALDNSAYNSLCLKLGKMLYLRGRLGANLDHDGCLKSFFCAVSF